MHAQLLTGDVYLGVFCLVEEHGCIDGAVDCDVRNILDVHGSGASVVDFDGDGLGVCAMGSVRKVKTQ